MSPLQIEALKGAIAAIESNLPHVAHAILTKLLREVSE